MIIGFRSINNNFLIFRQTLNFTRGITKEQNFDIKLNASRGNQARSTVLDSRSSLEGDISVSTFA